MEEAGEAVAEILGQRKGKGVMGGSSDMEREKEEERDKMIEELLDFQKSIEGVRPIEGLKDPDSFSVVDLELQMPRAGLGPEDITSLGLKEVDIGLQHPVVLKDYISPSRIEVALFPDSIVKCKKAYRLLRPTTKQRGISQPEKETINHKRCKECNWIQERMEYRKGGKK